MCTVLPEPGMAAHPRAHTRNTRPGDASTRSGTTPGHVRAISLIRPVPDHPNHRHNPTLRGGDSTAIDRESPGCGGANTTMLLHRDSTE